MAQVQEQMNGLTYFFESEASASFLVIICETKLIEYQMQMLEHNLVRNVIPPEMVRKEGVNHFYYNVTSKISLSFFLKRHKLSREEFMKLLLQITSAVSDSSGYLLGVSNFIFNPDYIYVNPETLEPSLVYVPAAISQNGCEVLQGFISDLLLMHIHVDGFDRGNFVQKILSAVSSDTFSIKGFAALMNGLMYGHEQNNVTIQPDGSILSSVSMQSSGSIMQPGYGEKDNISASINYKKDKKEEIKEEIKNKIADGNRRLSITIASVLLQFIMGGIIYLGRGFLQQIGDNQTATFAAVAMIVLAIDVLLYRKISAAKLISVNNKSGDSVEEKETDEAEPGRLSLLSAEAKTTERPETVRNTSSDKDSMSGRMTKDMSSLMPDNAPNQKEISGIRAEKIIYETELLVGNKTGGRFLRSTGKHSGDEDIPIDKDDFIIGRLDGHVDYILNNNAVGKLHIELINRNGACFVKDLNTVNGTFINNTRIVSNKEVELRENDRLRLANSEFVLVYE